MDTSRTGNSIRNTSNSMIAQIVGIILNFVSRTFFIKLLNADYLGVNGLFTDILTILSLAELGIGSAIMYMMYKPIAEQNTKKVAAYANFYRKVYNIIGCVILIVGLAITPFLYTFIGTVPDIDENIQIIYILFLSNTAVSYFFTYKRSLITAFQKEYLNSRNEILFALIKDIVQILILLVTRNYYFYLITQIATTLASNISISRKADKLFPELKQYHNEKLEKDETKLIAKNTVAMVSHKIGAVVVSGTDSILISTFVGLGTVGIYSNYKMLSTYLRQIVNRGINSITASVGNLVATSEKEKVYFIFKRIYFVNLIFSYFVGVCFYGVANSFILLWLGKDYLVNDLILLVISANLFFNQIRQPAIITINTYGLFWDIKWKSIIEAIINLAASIFLANTCKMGLLGVLLGTLISNLSTNIWWEPLIAYKEGMNKKVRYYYLNLLKDSIIFFLTIIIVYFVKNAVSKALSNSDFLCFLINGTCTVGISGIIFLLVYSRNPEFSYILTLARRLTKKVMKK